MKLFYRNSIPILITFLSFFAFVNFAQIKTQSQKVRIPIKKLETQRMFNLNIEKNSGNWELPKTTFGSGDIIFSEDFDGIPGPVSGGSGTYVFPSGWSLVNVDGHTPAAAVSYVNDAWERREDFKFNVGDSAAFSTSWYNPTGQADDWMISPAINLGKNSRLRWNAAAYDPQFPDGYEVRISTTAPNVAGCLANPPLFSIASENTAWTARTVDLDSAGYADQTVYIAWRNNSNDQFLLVIDDILVDEYVQHDAQLVSYSVPSEYTILPQRQMNPLNLGAVVKNNGLENLTDVRVRADIFQNGVNSYSEISGSVSVLMPDSSAQIFLQPYIPADTGLLEINYSILMNETDEDSSNGVGKASIYISSNELARDDGQCITGLGIGAGNGGEMGISFVLNAPANLTAVKVFLFKNYPQEPLYGFIRNFENGKPGDSVIAVTDSFYAPGTQGSWAILNIHGGTVLMPADTFVVTIIEGDSTLSLGQSIKIFTPKTTWVNWPTIPFGTWANLEQFGGSFSKPLMVRPIIEPPLILVDGIKDSFYTTLTSPDDGYLQIRSYACNNVGRPDDDNDLSAKVWTAWDSTWFYLYEEVMDDTLSANSDTYWQQDGLDLNFDPKPEIHFNSVKARITADGFGGMGYGDSLNLIADRDKQWIRKKVAGGYVIELAIRWSVFTYTDPEFAESVTPAIDSVFGFALVQYDNDERGYAHAAVAWAADMSHTFINGSGRLGRVQFLAGNKLKFLPYNLSTGKTNLIPYDGSDYDIPFISVDGVKDTFYTALTGPQDGYLQIRSFAYSSFFGEPENDADISAKVWTAWDSKWFYLYEEVKDDSLSGSSSLLSEVDGLELNFDPEPKDSIYNTVFSSYLTADGSNDLLSGDSLGNISDADKKWFRKNIPGGYLLELAIKWSAITSDNNGYTENIYAAKDSLFGFALIQHDNDGSGYNESSIIWASILNDSAHYISKYLGTVKFLSGHRLEFSAENKMTGTSNPVPYDGSDYVIDAVNKNKNIPSEFSLAQNYPNPFNPSTRINFGIPNSSFVNLTVYDILGNKVAELVNETKTAGRYEVELNGSNLSSGVYFYQIKAGLFVQTRKMILIK